MPAHVLLGDICVPPMPWSAAPGEGGAKEEVARTCLSSDAPPLPAGPMDVVDTCAAPGNKTSHAAMLLPPGPGQVLAFDKSEDRAALLRRRMGEVGARRVVVRCGDFLETDLSGPEFARARCALVDPSCSGSGMLRADHQTDRGRGAATAEGAVPESEAGRVANLAAFQEKVLWHALQLPAVHRVAYSTCSVYHRVREGAGLPGLASVSPLPSCSLSPAVRTGERERCGARAAAMPGGAGGKQAEAHAAGHRASCLATTRPGAWRACRRSRWVLVLHEVRPGGRRPVHGRRQEGRAVLGDGRGRHRGVLCGAFCP